MMREFATEFPVGVEVNRAAFLAQVVAWLRGKEDSLILDDYTDSDLEGEAPRLRASNGETLTFRELEIDGGHTLGFRHDTPDGEKVWRTEAVYHKAAGCVQGILRSRVQCLAARGLPELTIPNKPFFLKTMLQDGWAGEDVLLKVLDRVHHLSDDEDGVEIAAQITAGTAVDYLPVVYVSCANAGDHALSTNSLKRLAFRLGGVAHVVVEPSRSFSFRLKDACSGANVYAGSIGVFLPKKGLVRRFFLGGFLPTRTALAAAVEAEVIRLRALMAQKRSWDWVQLQEYHLRAMRERHRNQVTAAEYEKLWEEELAGKDERIARLEAELKAAREAQPLVTSEGILDDAFLSGLGAEIYEGEFSDRVRAALIDCVERGEDAGWDKRSIAVFNAMLERTAFSGRANALQSSVGAATRDAKHIAKKLPALLRDLGYEVKSERNHIRMEARPEMIGLEPVTLPKTPRVRIHNQNMTTAANAHADRKTLGHLS